LLVPLYCGVRSQQMFDAVSRGIPRRVQNSAVL
jgi:hypothetical protein